MITLTNKNLILILNELGYYEDQRYDKTLESYFKGRNIQFAMVRNYLFTLSFNNTKHETLFRLRFSAYL